MLVINDKLRMLVWAKGNVVSSYNPAWYRKDRGTAVIRWDEFNQKTLYGWTISYINPYKKEDKDSVDNLIPLHWENNEAKGNNADSWMAVVTSVGMYNLHVKRYIENVHL